MSAAVRQGVRGPRVAPHGNIGRPIFRLRATSTRTVVGTQQVVVPQPMPGSPKAPGTEASGNVQPATQLPASTLPGLQELQKAWDNVDIKQKVVLACSMAFCLSNTDKTIFTVAIIPMAVAYGWSPTVAGVVQSAFFYGFLLMQLPGGQMSTRLGGGQVLPKGLAVWSGATAAMPLVAGNLPALCLARGVMGAGEAVAPSSIIDMIAKTVPNEERASAVSFAFGGLHVGSIFGLLLAPAIIQTAGYPALFYTCGLAGMAWLLWFQSILNEVQLKDSQLAERLVHTHDMHMGAGSSAVASSAKQEQAIPYRAFLRSQPVQVLMLTHMCHNWFHYVMLSWLPTYFTSTLNVDLMHAAQTALLPPMAGIAASAAAGSLGDGLLARGMPVARVRKLMQSVAFLVPTACMAAVSQIPCDAEHSPLIVGLVTIALGVSSFSLAGLYCTHGDMSSKYSSALLGLTNVAGSLPGIVGVSFVGALYEQTHDWNLALFGPSAAMMLVGTAAYVAGSRHAPVDFDAADNSEFAVEQAIKSWWGVSPLSKAARVVGEAANGMGARVRGTWAHLQNSVKEAAAERQREQVLEQRRKRVAARKARR